MLLYVCSGPTCMTHTGPLNPLAQEYEFRKYWEGWHQAAGAADRHLKGLPDDVRATMQDAGVQIAQNVVNAYTFYFTGLAESLTPEQRRKCDDYFNDVVAGTRQACGALYAPPEQFSSEHGSKNDWQTDLGGLGTLLKQIMLKPQVKAENSGQDGSGKDESSGAEISSSSGSGQRV